MEKMWRVAIVITVKNLKFLLIIFLLFPLGGNGSEYESSKSLPVAHINPRLADREYVFNKLLTVFGPESKTILLENIYNKPNIFGGPCDIYSQVRPTENTLLDPMSDCFERNDNSQVPMIGKQSLLRSALMVKTCKLLTKNKKSFKHATTNINKTSKTESYFRLFHPFSTYSKQLDLKLSKIKDKKELLNLLCIDPSWQIL